MQNGICWSKHTIPRLMSISLNVSLFLHNFQHYGFLLIVLLISVLLCLYFNNNRKEFKTNFERIQTSRKYKDPKLWNNLLIRTIQVVVCFWGYLDSWIFYSLSASFNMIWVSPSFYFLRPTQYDFPVYWRL